MDTHENQSNRRGFFSKIGMFAGLIASYGTFAFYFLKFLLPPKKEIRYRKILATSIDQLRKHGSKTIRDLAEREIVIVETKSGLKAISTECTHLGCKVHWESEKDRFFCPCHDAVFDTDGNVVVGPPPRPLGNYEVSTDRNGNVFVKVKEV